MMHPLTQEERDFLLKWGTMLFGIIALILWCCIIAQELSK